MSNPPKHTFNAIFIIFHVKVISVEPLDVVQAINSYMEEVKKEEPLDAKKTKILYMEDDHEHKGKLTFD